MKRFIRILLPGIALAMTLGSSTCESSDNTMTPEIPDIPSVPDEPQQPAQPGRTVLVYMVANNSLGKYGCDDKDMDEMESAAALIPEGSRWIVYHAPSDNTIPVLLELTADGWVTLKEYDNNEYSVSSSRMTRVINDMQSVAGAEHYGLILWSHAHGWLQNGIEDTPAARPKSFGDDNGRTMNITTLASVLDGRGFDYIYADCCYMGNVEVAYELRNAADYLVASPSELPIDGMPYDRNLPLLADGSPESLIKAATNTFDHYNALTGINRTCTMSVIDLGMLDRLAAATAEVYSLPSLTYDHTYTPQRYMTERSCFYYDLRDYVTHHGGVGTELMQSWISALENTVMYEAATPYLWDRVPFESHCGLTTHIVNASADADTRNYRTLSWWRDVASRRPVAD